jgi:hypothetical protein
MMSGSLHLRLTLLALLGTCIGCPGALDDPARFADAGIDTVGADAAAGIDTGGPAVAPAEAGPGADSSAASTCPDVASAILAPTCATTGCHDAQDKVQGLDLQSPGLFARLAGVQATEGPGLLIDRASPPHSVLYTKLTASPPFGARMPLHGSLDDGSIACVLAWITESSQDAGIPEGGPDVGAGGE